jgi:hypothetical protein
MPGHTTALTCTDNFKENCIKDKCSREKNYNKISNNDLMIEME